SDNISPRHLLNIKRLAYETSPVPVRRENAAASGSPLPKAPPAPRMPGGLAAESLSRRIDQFLTSRGYTPPGTADATRESRIPAGGEPTAEPIPRDLAPTAVRPAESVQKAAEFVCEDDVRQAVKLERKIVIGERTIVTPAARDLAEQHRIFVQASWPR
ncbi:MAG TPA: hypothetical protein VK595_09125, partial [Vicinamibacterales bacterium]|nr:hypothetical protein [Vicinamibacterales bacterium]